MLEHSVGQLVDQWASDPKFKGSNRENYRHVILLIKVFKMVKFDCFVMKHLSKARLLNNDIKTLIVAASVRSDFVRKS
jgi:hypothetical protein